MQGALALARPAAVNDTAMARAKRSSPALAKGGSAPSPAARTSRDISYHTARSLEELDLADAATDNDAKLAHEQLAAHYLQTAIRLRRGELCRIVADRVD